MAVTLNGIQLGTRSTATAVTSRNIGRMDDGGVAGAALGSVMRVFGTAVGGMSGDWIGRRLFDEASSIF